MATSPEIADIGDPRRPIDRWLFSYSGDHVNPTNQLIHLICVPAILWSVTAGLWIIPVPAAKSSGFWVQPCSITISPCSPSPAELGT